VGKPITRPRAGLSFGDKSGHKVSSILNSLLLQARFLTFRFKVGKKTPNMHLYFLIMKKVKLLERKIAQKYGKLTNFQKKWSLIFEMLCCLICLLFIFCVLLLLTKIKRKKQENLKITLITEVFDWIKK